MLCVRCAPCLCCHAALRVAWRARYVVNGFVTKILLSVVLLIYLFDLMLRCSPVNAADMITPPLPLITGDTLRRLMIIYRC